MKRINYIIIFSILTMLLPCVAFGQSKNRLFIPDISFQSGSDFQIPVSLENTDEIYGVQFDLILPEGITALQNIRLNDRGEGLQSKLRMITSNRCRVMVYSDSNSPLIGNAGEFLYISCKSSSTLKEGEQYDLLFEDASLSNRSGEEVITGSSCGKMMVLRSPDLSVVSISSEVKTINPGDIVKVGWSITNIGGRPTASGWKEQLYLVSVKRDKEVLVSTTYHDDILANGSVSANSTEVTVPKSLGFEGDAYWLLKVVPNSDCGEPVTHRQNNSLRGSDMMQVSKALFLTLPTYPLDEKEGKYLECKILRSGDISNDEIFSIRKDGDARLEVPSEILISENQFESKFYIRAQKNGVIDESDVFHIHAEGETYIGVYGIVTMSDDTFPDLVLVSATEEIKEGNSVTMTVSIPKISDRDTEIKLSHEGGARLRMPSSVIIPAGDLSTAFNVEAVEDMLPDIDKNIAIIASASGYNRVEYLLEVFDNDMPNLEMTLSPSNVSENNGPLSVTATIKRTDNIDKAVTLRFSDNSNGKIYYGRNNIEMRSGVSEITVNLGPIDNDIVDGERIYDITAAVWVASCSCNPMDGKNGGRVTVPLTVYDNDGPCLSFTGGKSSMTEGEEITLTLKRNTDLSLPVEVKLTCDSEDVEYPASVIIPVGKNQVSFTIKSKNNSVADDSFSAQLIAEADGFSKAAYWFTVSDGTLPDGVINKLSVNESEILAYGSINVKIEVANEGSYRLPQLTPLTLYMNGDVLGNAYLQNDLMPGETSVIEKNFKITESVGEYLLYARINEDKYIKELTYANNSSNTLNVKIISPYTGQLEVSVEKLVYNEEEPIAISGRLIGENVAGQHVEIYVVNEGYRQSMITQTGDDGSFEATYKPKPGQFGNFIVGACFPNEKLKTAMCGFDILGLRSSGDLIHTVSTTVGEEYIGRFNINNPSSVSLNGVKAEIVSCPQNVSVRLNAPEVIHPQQSIELQYLLNADSVSPGDDWQNIVIKLTTAEGLTVQKKIFYYCFEKTGVLKPSETGIKTKVTKGSSKDYEFNILNKGKGESGEITFSLPSWMKCVTPSKIPSLKSGEETQVILRISSTDNMVLNMPMTGVIGVNCSNGKGFSLPYSVEPVSDSNGTLTVDVCDEYTYYTEEAPHLSGAEIVVRHPATGQKVATGSTGSDGIFETMLPEGYYILDVSSSKHSSSSQRILVEPSTDNFITVNLSYEAITINWEVEETEEEDEYEIVATVDYEVSVPVPVVITEAPKSLPMEDLSEGETLIFNVLVTNKGLISAKDVQFELPEGFKTIGFEQLAYLEPFVLAPQQSINIPFRVTKLKNRRNIVRKAAESDEGKDEEENDKCGFYLGTISFYECGSDRKWHRYTNYVQVYSCKKDNGGRSWDDNGGYNNGRGWGGNWLPVLPIYIPEPSGPGGGGKQEPRNFIEDPDPKEPEVGMPFNDCEPCENAYRKGKIGCIIDNIPVLSDLKNIFDCLTSDKRIMDTKVDSLDYKAFMYCGINYIKDNIGDIRDKIKDKFDEKTNNKSSRKKLISFLDKILDFSRCLDKVKDKCDPNDVPGSITKDVLQKNESMFKKTGARPEPSYLEEFRGHCELIYNEIGSFMKVWEEFFGNDFWINKVPQDELYSFMNYIYDVKDDYLDYKKCLEFKPSDVPESMLKLFVDRLNNTTRVNKGILCEDSNRIDPGNMMKYLNEILDIEEICALEGYTSSAEYLQEAVDVVIKRLQESRENSVCSSITVQFSQTMVMTRQAFTGSLKVYNGNTEEAMKDITLSLVLTDENGNIATSHEFQVNLESINGFVGDKTFDAGWSLGPEENGNALIKFIPTKYAAPENETLYSFGGTLSYIDPFQGIKVVRELTPVTLTVNPSPNLNLTYFMQRDILGDDPLTESVEPMEESEFSLLITNEGYGDAKNVKITTKAPEIISNDKGLLIDFDLVSSQLNGGDKTLPLDGKVVTDFGRIPAKGSSYAQWWITSSLLGHFTSYDITATHVSDYDNPDLSLLNEISIHELIRSLEVGDGDRRMAGFLVNDEVDGNDAPDMIYFSDGEKEPVAKATSVAMEKIADNQYLLKVTPMSSGWNYGFVADATAGRAQIESVMRKNDGKYLSIRNFWQTDRVLRDGKDPLYVNRIHFADEFGKGEQDYLITVIPLPEVGLEVSDISGVPNKLATEPVNSLKVLFNKDIDSSSFSHEDIELTVQGEKRNIADALKITVENPRTFNIDLSAVTDSASNGYYTFTVNTAGIIDHEGYNGKVGKRVCWTLFRGGLVQLNTSVYPEDTGKIIMEKVNETSSYSQKRKESSVADQISYGQNIRLKAIPAEGFIHSGWKVNGDDITDLSVLDITALSDMEIIANFSPSRKKLEVVFDETAGNVSGAATGYYNFGNSLRLEAEAKEDFRFEHWLVNGEINSSENIITIKVDDDKKIEAVFKRTTHYHKITFRKGWNWISTIIGEDQAINHLYGKITRIIGAEGESKFDVENGLIGDMMAFKPGQSYKVESASTFLDIFSGTLFSQERIKLSTGCNWLSNPSMEVRSISTLISGASDGDIIASQNGFTQYYAGMWEGTLESFIPGEGYLYWTKSGHDIVISEGNALVPFNTQFNDIPSEVDVRKYPHTMNIVAVISEESGYSEPDQYTLYAAADNECRGVSKCVGLNHYLTVYGENEDEIRFILEDNVTGERFNIKERRTFHHDNLGSRIEPLIFNMDSVITGIDDLFINNQTVSVFGIDGTVIDLNADREKLERLPKGVYLINGMKIIL